jgi:hypothetical protein
MPIVNIDEQQCSKVVECCGMQETVTVWDSKKFQGQAIAPLLRSNIE